MDPDLLERMRAMGLLPPGATLEELSEQYRRPSRQPDQLGPRVPRGGPESLQRMMAWADENLPDVPINMPVVTPAMQLAQGHNRAKPSTVATVGAGSLPLVGDAMDAVDVREGVGRMAQGELGGGAAQATLGAAGFLLPFALGPMARAGDLGSDAVPGGSRHPVVERMTERRSLDSEPSREAAQLGTGVKAAVVRTADGNEYDGQIHALAMQAARDAGDYSEIVDADLFRTHDGEVISRAEALRRGKATGQLGPRATRAGAENFAAKDITFGRTPEEADQALMQRALQGSQAPALSHMRSGGSTFVLDPKTGELTDQWASGKVSVAERPGDDFEVPLDDPRPVRELWEEFARRPENWEKIRSGEFGIGSWKRINDPKGKPDAHVFDLVRLMDGDTPEALEAAKAYGRQRGQDAIFHLNDEGTEIRLPERVTEAAIILEDGTRFEGRNHGAALTRAVEATGRTEDDILENANIDAFVTSKGRVLDRKQLFEEFGERNAEDIVPQQGGVVYGATEPQLSEAQETLSRIQGDADRGRFVYETPEGEIEVQVTPEGERLQVDWFGRPGTVGPHESAPLGPGLSRRILDDVFQAYPDAQTFSYERSTGAGPRRTAERPIRRREGDPVPAFSPDPDDPVLRPGDEGPEADLAQADEVLGGIADGRTDQQRAQDAVRSMAEKGPVPEEIWRAVGLEPGGGAPHIARYNPPRPRGTVLDLSGLSEYPRIPGTPQRGTELYVPTRTPAKLEYPLGRARKANDERIRDYGERGLELGGHRWHDTYPIYQRFEEIAGEEGIEDFFRLMQYSGVSSFGSSPATEIRRGTMAFVAEKQGRQMPRSQAELGALVDDLYGPGFADEAKKAGGAGALTHQNQLDYYERIARGEDWVYNPDDLQQAQKGRPYTAAHMGDFAGFTVDRHQKHMLVQPHTRLFPTMKSRTTVNPTEFHPIAQFYRDQAEDLDLPLSSWQAATWTGAGNLGVTDVSDIRPYAELFDDKIVETARLKGISPSKMIELLVRGQHPLWGLGGLAAYKAAGANVVNPNAEEHGG